MSAAGSTLRDVVEALHANEREARRTISMVPSENAMSALARLPLLLDAYHRYRFGDGDDAAALPEFRGGELVAHIESDVTLPLLRELGEARHASVRPLSGLSAMTLALAALGGEPGETVLTVAPAQGGHYATAGIAARLGLLTASLGGPNAHTIDLDAAAQLAATTKPALAYIDQANCLFPVDLRALVEAVRDGSPSTIVHFDASHWLGLILGGAFPNPLACGADSYGGSTHKTFPGPQKAVVLTNRDDLAVRLKAMERILISSHHLGASLSLGLALLEFRSSGRRYAEAAIASTQRFARNLHARRIPVAAPERGFSAGHQLWIDTEAGGVPAQEASDRLFAAGLRSNVLPELPGIPRPAVRVGLNEATHLGLRGAQIDELADIFARALSRETPGHLLAERVAALRAAALEPPTYDRDLLRRALDLCALALLGQEDASRVPELLERSPAATLS